MSWRLFYALVPCWVTYGRRAPTGSAMAKGGVLRLAARKLHWCSGRSRLRRAFSDQCLTDGGADQSEHW